MKTSADDAVPELQIPDSEFDLRAWLQLMRLPALFTAMADIFLGYLLVHRSFEMPLEFVLLLIASSGLYLSGMVFNDVFDRQIDAAERPTRPIPSGRICLRAAVRLGTALMALGVLAAAAVGTRSLLIAALLVLGVLGYDGLLKRTVLGPVAMGACRFLNVLLGASTAEILWAAPQLPVAAGLGLYVAGVTWFARREAVAGNRLQLTAAAGLVNAGLLLLLGLIAGVPAELAVFPQMGRGPSIVWLLFGVIALTINRRLVAAVLDPAPRQVQRAVRIMLLSLITLDATFVLLGTGRPDYALATAALIIPALTLGRWLFVT